MYICPICSKECATEASAAKHLLTCWRREHPYHQSKPAPTSANIEIKKVNEDIMSFFGV